MVVVFGNAVFDVSGSADAVVVVGNAILDISFVATEEISSMVTLLRLWESGERFGPPGDAVHGCIPKPAIF